MKPCFSVLLKSLFYQQFCGSPHVSTLKLPFHPRLGSPQNTSENAQLWGMIEALEMALQAEDCLVNDGCRKYNPTNM